MADVLLTLRNDRDRVYTIVVRIADGFEIRTCRSTNPSDVIEATFVLGEHGASIARVIGDGSWNMDS